MIGFLDENTTIKDLTNGEFSSLRYDATGNNYTGKLVEDVVGLIERAGGNVPNSRISSTDSVFRDTILSYQKKFGLAETGILDDDLLHDIYKRATETSNNEIFGDNEYDSYDSSDKIYDPHYDPFFLSNSEKIARRNHKDIVISIGNGANKKTIKDVFMRSVSVQVDTSGNPISEVYSFIARDIKESDAPEDINKYVGEQTNLSASSDIKYSYDSLFKDP